MVNGFALAKAIEKIGEYDLVLCGRQAADWDAGQVGSGIADILGLPSVTVVRKIDITDGHRGSAPAAYARSRRPG